jgi:FMN phosphatase YigB (HAD superfamily)
MARRRLNRRSSPSVLSLDVFDTALTRGCGPPSAAFLMLGRQLSRRGLLPSTPEHFARARVRADREVWFRSGGLDAPVVLEDFYAELCRSLWLDPKTIPLLVNAELQLEATLLRPVPQTRQLIDRYAASGARVVFITDTYFPRQFIEDQLRRSGLWVTDARVFASSEYTTSKAGGGLFDQMTCELGLDPRDVVHMGDNRHSDVAMPRTRGLRAVHLGRGELNRYESCLAGHQYDTAGLSAALAGASRLARLRVDADGPLERPIRDVACGVAAPFLVAYVLWLLKRAHQLGIKRLYFLSRDGQVLVEVARTMASKMAIEMDLRYLYASRDSTNLAATVHAGEEELGWIERDLDDLTVQQLLARFDISAADLQERLPNLPVSLNSAAGSSDVHQIWRALSGTDAGRSLVLYRAAQRRSVVMSYLRQEGVLDNVPGAFVDFGGVGSQMRALHSLTVLGGGQRPRLFLVGLDDPAAAGLSVPESDPDWLVDTECYLYDHRRRTGMRRRRGFGTLVQMFVAADHGTVTGYARRDDMVVPQLQPDIDDEVIRWGLATFRAAVAAFVHHLELDNDLVDVDADLRAAVTEVIDLLWSDPSYSEAQAWGAFPFEGAQVVSSDRQRLAAPYTWATVARGVRDGTFPDLGWMHWFEASLRLSRAMVRIPLSRSMSVYRWLERTSDPRATGVLRLMRRVLGRPEPRG